MQLVADQGGLTGVKRDIRFIWDASPSMRKRVPYFVPLLEEAFQRIRESATTDDPNEILVAQMLFGDPENVCFYPNPNSAKPVAMVDAHPPTSAAFEEQISRNSGTALIDAIALGLHKTIKHLGEGYSGTVILVTDGHENSSRRKIAEGRERVLKALAAGIKVVLIGFVLENEEQVLRKFASDIGIPDEAVGVHVHRGDDVSVAAAMGATSMSIVHHTTIGHYRA